MLFKALLPDKPPNLQVTNVKSRSAEITWQAPEDTGVGRLERFLIKLTKDNSLIWNKTTEIEYTYTLNNLTPYTTYKISVAAENQHGFGEETTESLTTPEDGKNLTHIKLHTLFLAQFMGVCLGCQLS